MIKSYSSIYSFKESSFSNSAVKKVLILFNRLLSKRIGIKLYGSPDIYDIVQTPDGKFYTFTYDYGKGLAVRYRVKINQTSSIFAVDFYFKPYFDLFPTFTMETEDINLIQLLNIVSNTIITRKTSEEVILNESISLKESASYLTQLVSGLPPGASGFKQYLQTGPDIDEMERLLPVAKGKDFEKILKKYNLWARSNKQKLYSSVGTFKTHFRKAVLDSGLASGAVIEVRPARKAVERSIPTRSDEAIEKAAQLFRGTVNERFAEMNDNIEDVAKGLAYSYIILGDPGIGKTYGVEQVLKENGLTVEEVDPQIEFEIDDETGEEVAVMPEVDPSKYILVKGKITPSALYSMLYMYNNALIVFDDSDDALKKDPNLVKAATDTKKRRKLTNASARTMGRNSLFPPSFLYTGRCIFISNLYADQVDSAIMSRGNVIELNLTSEEMIDRARSVTPFILEEIPGSTKAFANEVLEFLSTNSSVFGKLDLRTYGQAIKARVKGSPDWKNRVGRSILTKAKSLAN